MTHGAYSDEVAVPLAEEIESAVLEDAGMPPHLRSPGFAFARRAWARAEAESQLIYEWMQRMPVEERVRPPLPGTKAPVDTWKSVDAHAGRLRGKLGLDPASYASLRKDLGLAAKAQEDALGAMAKAGAVVAERRTAALEAGPAGDGSDG